MFFIVETIKLLTERFMKLVCYESIYRVTSKDVKQIKLLTSVIRTY